MPERPAGASANVMTEMTNFTKDLGRLDGAREEMTAILKDWCAINSGSGNLDGLAKMHKVLADAFQSLEGTVETVRSDPHSIVTDSGEIVEQAVGACLRVLKRPQAPIRVLLAGHMDTVFPSDHSFQNFDMLDADTMNAPGAADMKGGLLVMLFALRAIEQSPLADRIGYEVIINADEEIGSHGSAALLKEAGHRAQFACIYEPALADGTLAGARKGSGNFAAIIHGKSVHAGREHHLGRNALVAAAEFISKVDSLTGKKEGLTVNVARVDGGGPNNVVPDRAIVRFNVRVDQPEDSTWLMESVTEMIEDINRRDGFTAQLHGGFSRPPKPMTQELQSFFEALKSVGSELGLSIGWKATGGCCDGNNIAATGIPVIDTLGVRGANIHSADEYVCLDSLEERAKLSALLLLRIAAGDIPVPGKLEVS